MGCIFHKWKEWTIGVTKNGIECTRRFLRLCLKCDEKERITDTWLLAPGVVPNNIPVAGLSNVTRHEKLTDDEFHKEICLIYEKKT